MGRSVPDRSELFLKCQVMLKNVHLNAIGKDHI